MIIFHWYQLCSLPVSVKLEEMDEAEPFIFKTLNFTSEPKYTPLRKGKYNNTYASHYTDIPKYNIEKIYDVYKADIDLFEYPHSPFEWHKLEIIRYINDYKWVNMYH